MNKDKLRQRDGHIHSPFCPHGTKDNLELYIQEALKHNLIEITFTEHMDFPRYFITDKEFLDECAPNSHQLNSYFKEVAKLKSKYKDKIKINIGLEVDYLDGLEEEIKDKLDSYGTIIEDSILSVHFIKLKNDEYVAIDCLDGFKRAMDVLGSIKNVYDKYYQTLLTAVRSDLGNFKPNRIGHPNLIRRFNELYPIDYDNYELLEEIAKEIKKRNYEVDMNTAGLRKKYCNEIYVSGYFKKLVEKYNIKIVFGSDSHTALDVARDFDKVK